MDKKKVLSELSSNEGMLKSIISAATLINEYDYDDLLTVLSMHCESSISQSILDIYIFGILDFPDP